MRLFTAKRARRVGRAAQTARKARGRARRSSSSGPRRPGMALVGLGAAAAGFVALRDNRRRHMAADRTTATLRRGGRVANRRGRYTAGVVGGLAERIASPLRQADRDYDDVTLARKVESEIFRRDDVPKGQISVNAQHGVVELRGEVKRPEQVREIGDAARDVAGVRDVHNLLHTPGSPPGHTPPSSPDEVRARAGQPDPVSGFGQTIGGAGSDGEPGQAGERQG